MAVKGRPASMSPHPDRLRRFEVEAKAAGQLEPPDILAIRDPGLRSCRRWLSTLHLEEGLPPELAS